MSWYDTLVGAQTLDNQAFCQHPYSCTQVDDEPAPRQEVLEFAVSLQNPKPEAAESSTTTLSSSSSESSASIPLTERSRKETTPSETVQQAKGSVESSEHKSDSSESARPADSSESKRPERGEAVEEKRVRNTRIIQELGVVLQYPTYKEGIAAIQSNIITPFTEADMVFLQGISSRVN